MILQSWHLFTEGRRPWRPRRVVGVGAATFALLLSFSQAFASIPQIREVKVITPGSLEPFTTTFQVPLAPDAKAPSLSFSDWQGPQGAPLRNYPLATATQSTTQPGLWLVAVTLPNVSAVGTYKGRLSVKSPAPATPPAPEDYELIFTSSFKPAMTLSHTSSVTLKVSNCEWLCSVTKLFLPDEAGSFGFEARNNSPAAVDITVSHVPLGAMSVTPSLVLATAGSSATSTLTISSVPPGAGAKFFASVQNAASLDPAAYVGNLRVFAQPAGSGGAADPAPFKQADGTFGLGNATVSEIPLAVNVRSQALYALIVCVLGVAVGRFLSTLASPGFDTKLKYFPEYRAVYNSVGQLANTLVQLGVTEDHAAELAAALRERVDALWRRILDGTEAAATAAFDALRKHVKLTLRWGKLHQLMAANPQLPAQICSDADGLRKRLLAPLADVTTYESDLETLRNQVLAWIAQQNPGTESIVVDRQGADDVDADSDPGIANGLRARLAWLFDLLAGTGTAGVKFYYDFARPIVHIVLLVMLVLYGVWINYSTGTTASTFGSARLGDYAGLFLWGITADLISKGFRGITFGRP